MFVATVLKPNSSADKFYVEAQAPDYSSEKILASKRAVTDLAPVKGEMVSISLGRSSTLRGVTCPALSSRKVMFRHCPLKMAASMLLSAAME